MSDNKRLLELISKLEELERNKCNIPILFTEVFKDEINAIDEIRLYNGIKRLVKKYANENENINAIDEFTRVISGGASLGEILQLTIDEAVNPSSASAITVDNSCNLS